MSQTSLQSLVSLGTNWWRRAIAKGWVPKGFNVLSTRVADTYRTRNELLYGGVMVAGGVPTAFAAVDVTALAAKLSGLAQVKIAIEDLDLAPAAVGDHALLPIDLDGDTATLVTTLDTAGDEMECVVVLINSDGVGAPDGTFRFLVVHGAKVAAAATGTAVIPSSKQVADAIAASSAHASHGGWTIVGDFLLTRTGDNAVVSSIRYNPSNYLNL